MEEKINRLILTAPDGSKIYGFDKIPNIEFSKWKYDREALIRLIEQTKEQLRNKHVSNKGL